MSNRITLEEVAEMNCYQNVEDMIMKYAFESVVPACCEEGCEVEPDGKCPHKNPSILIEAGIC